MDEDQFEVYRSLTLRHLRREWRWRYRATNGRIIAQSSEGYVNKHHCLAMINMVSNSGGAPVTEV